ncbi:hypothetical protein PN441_14615 [Spirulina major CS-329]|uniref:hypothetical protein n=1 Tax=Spirulina TaxID=1154 RepID=UPI00232CE17E|nr:MULTISPECIES: hypothetical protein [Spirulina]MDB9495541.1 hypothetical protein [Spirulina subsalsa CS-330]MDB9504308.1 hypothetical protein [Spirulina major CS-329]
MKPCSSPGCTNLVKNPDHPFCYSCWKKTQAPSKPAKPRRERAIVKPTPTIDPPAPTPDRLTATQISKALQDTGQTIHRNAVNRLFSELGLLEKEGGGWVATERGFAFGATQHRHPKTGNTYVLWDAQILENRIFLTSLKNQYEASLAAPDPSPDPTPQSEPPSPILNPATPTRRTDSNFREAFRSGAKFRTTDGHWVRSKAEVMIDNWLYMAEIVHAYERRLPIEAEVYCDFYIPSCKVYLEYWGYLDDPAYQKRKAEKKDLYNAHNFKLIELTDHHIQTLDDHLPKLLHQFGINVM